MQVNKAIATFCVKSIEAKLLLNLTSGTKQQMKQFNNRKITIAGSSKKLYLCEAVEMYRSDRVGIEGHAL